MCRAETPASYLHAFLHSQTQYSSLHVTGSATLAGTIELDPVLGFDSIGDPIGYFLAQAGDAFKVLTYATRSGTFANIIGQNLTGAGPDYIFNPHYNATDLTFVVETLDPKVLIGNLEGVIAIMGLDPGTASSLNAKLDAALSALQRGNSTAACGQLGAALNYASAQSGKKLTQDQAGLIISTVQQIRAKVGCR